MIVEPVLKFVVLLPLLPTVSETSVGSEIPALRLRVFEAPLKPHKRG